MSLWLVIGVVLLAILVVAVLYDAAYRRRTGHRLNLGGSWWDAHTGTAAEFPPERPALEARRRSRRQHRPTGRRGGFGRW